jgi:negative regulator of flagellin synthesis FlgM
MISKIKDASTPLIQQYQKNDFTKSDADRQVAGQAGIAERVNLSTKAKDIQQIKQLLDQIPETRDAKIMELKQQIESGNYRIDAGKIAEKMVGESLIDLFA